MTAQNFGFACTLPWGQGSARQMAIEDIGIKSKDRVVDPFLDNPKSKCLSFGIL